MTDMNFSSEQLMDRVQESLKIFHGNCNELARHCGVSALSIRAALDMRVKEHPTQRRIWNYCGVLLNSGDAPLTKTIADAVTTQQIGAALRSLSDRLFDLVVEVDGYQPSEDKLRRIAALKSEVTILKNRLYNLEAIVRRFGIE